MGDKGILMWKDGAKIIHFEERIALVFLLSFAFDLLNTLGLCPLALQTIISLSIFC